MKSFPYTPRAKTALALANKISKELGHNFVGSEHLLLAIFRLKDGAGRAMLAACKASEELARATLAAYYSGRPCVAQSAEATDLKSVKSQFKSERTDLSPRDSQWLNWINKHGVSDKSIAAFLGQYPPDPTYITCGKCGEGFTLTQETVRFWPDHLWPGKVQAWFRCPQKNCLEKSWIWAHDLPAIWLCLDVPVLDWEKYQMRRLLYSCSFHGITPLPEPIPKLPPIPPAGWLERLLNRIL